MVVKHLFGRVCRVMSIALMMLTAIFILAVEEGDSWPQYRGKDRDGVSHTDGLMKTWPETGPKELWRSPIGSGFSGISAAGDKLYTMDSKDEKEYLICLNQNDGKEVWRLEVGEMFVDEFGNGPRSTPAVDGDVVYALASKGHLFAVIKDSGKVNWKITFTEHEALKTRVPNRGFTTSPMIFGDTLLVEAGTYTPPPKTEEGAEPPKQEEQPQKDIGEGSAILALSKKDGSILWSACEGVPGYSSPIQFSLNGENHFVFISAGRVIGLSDKGKVLWSKALEGYIFTMPVFVGPDKVFVSSTQDSGCWLFQITPNDGKYEVNEVWAGRMMRNHFNSSVYYNGHLYGFDNATLKCLDGKDGSQKWAKRGLGKGSLVAAAGRLYVVSDQGKLVVVDSDPTAYKELGSIQAMTGKSWTTPTLVNQKLFMRNLTEIVGYDLKN